MSEQQLSLPYEEITKDKLANRDYLRKNFGRGKETYLVPVSSLVIREGFNKRIVYEGLEELAESIKENGIKEPLVVDVMAGGRIFIEKGHRRYKAIQLLISKGFKIDTVECFINNRDVTEQQRMEDIFNSNMFASKLNPVEQANTVYALKNNFGKISNEDIAKKIGVSRQQVDNLLILADAGDDTKQEIINGNLGVTEAIKYIRNLKKVEKESDKAEMDANKTSAAAPSLPADPLANDLKELAELEEETAEEKDQRLLRENTKREQEREQLLEISDEITVRPDTLGEHTGRKLSAPVIRKWVEDFIDEDNGDVVSIDRNEVVVKKDTVLTEEVIDQILFLDSPSTILVYKKGMEPVAKSVVTVLSGGDDDTVKYDMDRIEIQQIQNVIKNFDKLSGIVSRIDCCPEQTKTDVEKLVDWTQRDLAEIRTWIHKNKKQNKSR